MQNYSSLAKGHTNDKINKTGDIYASYKIERPFSMVENNKFNSAMA